MASRVLTVDEIMAILPETPRRIAALTEGLTPTQFLTGSDWNRGVRWTA
ncbi:MAG: hypothetical protein ACRDGE_03985 [Candidatus Limnocylindria bacterium]